MKNPLHKNGIAAGIHRIGRGKERKVRIKDIRSPQHLLDKGKVRKLRRFTKNMPGTPTVSHAGHGKYVVKDGNHRIVAALQQGKRKVTAKVQRLEAIEFMGLGTAKKLLKNIKSQGLHIVRDAGESAGNSSLQMSKQGERFIRIPTRQKGGVKMDLLAHESGHEADYQAGGPLAKIYRSAFSPVDRLSKSRKAASQAYGRSMNLPGYIPTQRDAQLATRRIKMDLLKENRIGRAERAANMQAREWIGKEGTPQDMKDYATTMAPHIGSYRQVRNRRLRHVNEEMERLSQRLQSKLRLIQFDLYPEDRYETMNNPQTGEQWHIGKLMARVQDREPERIPLSRIKGTNKDGSINKSSKSGFSKKRYAAADTSYPLFVDEDDLLINGRHRALKMKDAGRKSARVIRISDKDLEAVEFDAIDKLGEKLTKKKKEATSPFHDIATGGIEGGLGILATDPLLHRVQAGHWKNPFRGGVRVVGKNLLVGAGVGAAATGLIGAGLNAVSRKKKEVQFGAGTKLSGMVRKRPRTALALAGAGGAALGAGAVLGLRRPTAELQRHAYQESAPEGDPDAIVQGLARRYNAPTAYLSGSKALGIDVPGRSDVDVHIPVKSAGKFRKIEKRLGNQFTPSEFYKPGMDHAGFTGEIDGVPVDIAITHGEKGFKKREAIRRVASELTPEEKEKIIQKKMKIQDSPIAPKLRYMAYKRSLDVKHGIPLWKAEPLEFGVGRKIAVLGGAAGAGGAVGIGASLLRSPGRPLDEGEDVTGKLLWRRSPIPLVRHYGVGLGPDEVAHIQPRNKRNPTGMQMTNVGGFKGRYDQIHVERERPRSEKLQEQMKSYTEEYKKNPKDYNLVVNNCEQFANSVLRPRKPSSQVGDAGVAGSVGAITGITSILAGPKVMKEFKRIRKLHNTIRMIELAEGDIARRYVPDELLHHSHPGIASAAYSRVEPRRPKPGTRAEKYAQEQASKIGAISKKLKAGVISPKEKQWLKEEVSKRAAQRRNPTAMLRALHKHSQHEHVEIAEGNRFTTEPVSKEGVPLGHKYTDREMRQQSESLKGHYRKYGQQFRDKMAGTLRARANLRREVNKAAGYKPIPTISKGETMKPAERLPADLMGRRTETPQALIHIEKYVDAHTKDYLKRSAERRQKYIGVIKSKVARGIAAKENVNIGPGIWSRVKQATEHLETGGQPKGYSEKWVRDMAGMSEDRMKRSRKTIASLTEKVTNQPAAREGAVKEAVRIIDEKFARPITPGYPVLKKLGKVAAIAGVLGGGALAGGLYGLKKRRDREEQEMSSRRRLIQLGAFEKIPGQRLSKLLGRRIEPAIVSRDIEHLQGILGKRVSPTVESKIGVATNVSTNRAPYPRPGLRDVYVRYPERFSQADYYKYGPNVLVPATEERARGYLLASRQSLGREAWAKRRSRSYEKRIKDAAEAQSKKEIAEGVAGVQAKAGRQVDIRNRSLKKIGKQLLTERRSVDEKMGTLAASYEDEIAAMKPKKKKGFLGFAARDDKEKIWEGATRMGISSATTGSLFGLIAGLAKTGEGPAFAKANLKKAAKAAAIGGGLFGAAGASGALLGAAVMGRAKKDDPTAYTKRGLIGGVASGLVAGGTIGALALRNKKAAQFVAEHAKDWRPVAAVKNARLARRMAIGAATGAVAIGAQASDEGQQVDTLRNLKREKERAEHRMSSRLKLIQFREEKKGVSSGTAAAIGIGAAGLGAAVAGGAVFKGMGRKVRKATQRAEQSELRAASERRRGDSYRDSYRAARESESAAWNEAHNAQTRARTEQWEDFMRRTRAGSGRSAAPPPVSREQAAWNAAARMHKESTHAGEKEAAKMAANKLRKKHNLPVQSFAKKIRNIIRFADPQEVFVHQGMTGRLAVDRYRKRIKDEDAALRDANLLKTMVTGGALGALMKGKTPASIRALAGSALGATGVVGIRATTAHTKDAYGERSREAKALEGIPWKAAGLGAAVLAGKRAYDKIKTVKMPKLRHLLEARFQLINFAEDRDFLQKQTEKWTGGTRKVNIEERSKDILRISGRAVRLKRDIAARRRGEVPTDARGRPKKPEWEKPWAKTAMLLGGIGAGVYGLNKLRGAQQHFVEKAIGKQAAANPVEVAAANLEKGYYYKYAKQGFQDVVEKAWPGGIKMARDAGAEVKDIINKAAGRPLANLNARVKKKVGDVMREKPDNVIPMVVAKGKQEDIEHALRKGKEVLEPLEKKLKGIAKEKDALKGHLGTIFHGSKVKPIHFAETVQDWRITDERGKSARVYAPGHQRRNRREKEWHEKKANRDIMSVLATVAAAGGAFYVGRKTGFFGKKSAQMQAELDNELKKKAIREGRTTYNPMQAHSLDPVLCLNVRLGKVLHA